MTHLTAQYSHAEKLAFAAKLRANMTLAERCLTRIICPRYMGVEFFVQAIVQGFIADFWCPSRNLVIELDGSIHRNKKAKERDAWRDACMLRVGIRTLRLTNGMVLDKTPTAMKLIRELI